MRRAMEQDRLARKQDEAPHEIADCIYGPLREIVALGPKSDYPKMATAGRRHISDADGIEASRQEGAEQVATTPSATSARSLSV